MAGGLLGAVPLGLGAEARWSGCWARRTRARSAHSWRPTRRARSEARRSSAPRAQPGSRVPERKPGSPGRCIPIARRGGATRSAGSGGERTPDSGRLDRVAAERDGPMRVDRVVAQAAQERARERDRETPSRAPHHGGAPRASRISSRSSASGRSSTYRSSAARACMRSPAPLERQTEAAVGLRGSVGV